MDEEINKVKTAIRRIRPLLLHLQNPSSPRRNGDVDDAPLSSSSSRLGRTAIVDKNDEKDARSSLASSDAIIANSSSNDDEMIEQGGFAKNSSGNDDDGNLLHAEEAVTELANGLSLLLREMDRSIYYNAAASYDDDDDDDDDCYTDDEMIRDRGHRKRKRDGSNGQSSKKSLHHHHATPTTPTTTTRRQQRDYENIKILLQEGYGLLFQTTTTESSTMKSRKIILSSLVKRLISVDTNYCRHLLLTDYIPHFIILPLLPPNTADTATSHMTTNNNNRNDVFGGLPDWLIDANEYDATTTNKEDDNIRNHRMVGSTISTTTTMANDTSNNSNSSSSRSIHEEEEIQQLLQAFAMMIHNDITILPPFLSLLSTLFTTTTITNDDDNEQITSLMMLLADTKEEENYNAYDLGVVDNDKDDTDDDDDDDVASNKFSSRKTYNASTAMITNTTASNSSITSSIKNVREYCFQSCLSVLSSYTLSPNTTTTRQQQQQQMQQNDLSCLLHSLFKLVDTKQEGRCVIIALRNVWKSVVVTTTLQQKKRQNNYGDENHDTTTSTAAADNYGHDLFSIGNIILQSILSFEYKVSKSRYLIYGYMFALGRELHCQKNGEGTEGGGDAKILNEQHQPSEKFSLLDTIVLIALYTNLEYSTLIESIIDSLSNEQTLSLLQLILSLIQSWIPPLSSDNNNNNNNNSGRVCGQQKQQRKNSLLYEQLASPLMSILFYIMISCSSKVTTHDDDGTASSILGSSSSLLVGGLLPFHSVHASSTTAATTDVINRYIIIIDTCCHVSSKLYAAMDTQRQQQLISSLLAMVSDSFVRSVPTDLSSVTYQQLRHRKKEMNKNTHGVSNNAKDTKLLLHGQKLILLESARTACCTILLIANGCASDLVQIRGTVINQILILASKLDNNDSAATNNEECKDDTNSYHHLFDMNCAIVISLLQDTTTITPTLRSDSGNSSELLILCQKLLFTSNFASTTTNSTYQHRVICGIILAARLLRCKLIPIIERESIWTWVITVITPSVSLNRTPLDALDPKIAHWGLTFLQFTTTCISPPPPPPLSCESDIVPKTFHYIETQPISGDGEGFNQVNRMLATASIVQMEDSLRMPVANGTGDDDIPKAFLAFGKDHDQLRNKKTATGSNMVICAPYFLHGKIKQKGVLHVSDTASAAAFTGIKSLPSINVVANYVYALVDRYLELGTQKSGKWNPRGWLLAKVQLPSCLSMSAMEILGMNKEYGLELDSITYCGMTDSFDGTDDNFLKRWRLLFVDEVKPKVTIVENLVQFVNCVVISISVSCAVLKHAYHHLQQEETIDSNEASMLESTTMSDEAIVDAQLPQRRRRKQLEVLRKLLYFQVSKIHTLQRICKNIYLALDGLHSEVCRLSSIERTMQRMPRNNLTSDSHTKEEGADCDARDATRRNEHKVRILFHVFVFVLVLDIVSLTQLVSQQIWKGII